MELIRANQAIFCEECGARLRSWDFFKGRAFFLGRRAFCDPCRPVPAAPPLPGRDTAWRVVRNRQLF
jgi:hypothetical protein